MTRSALTGEILRHGLVAAAEEASIVVVRAAYSAFIVEGSDASAAILDRRGRLVAQSSATTLAHSASLRACLPAVVAQFGLDEMSPGDVFALNDVYLGGIHANDIVVFQPVFVGGRLEFFCGTLIHVADLGGLAAGGMASTATEVLHEGLQLPPVRLAVGGEPVDDILRVLAANSRTPRETVGDVQALMAGTTVAASRLVELVEELGPATVAEGVDHYLASTERAMRRAIAGMEPGTYGATFPVDDDGITEGRSYTVAVTVTVAGDRTVVDFAGTDAQSPGAINAGPSQVVSGALFALRCFLDPALPMNEGCFAPVEFRLPEGTLVNPRPPAACGGRFMVVFAAIDAIWSALSAAVPGRAVAASGILTPFTLSGATGAGPWVHMAYDFGGTGARAGLDGLDATGPHFGIGRGTVPQVEPIEARCPLIFEEVALRRDSGGPGRWRGGLGTRTTIRLLDAAVLTIRADRHRFAPAGLDGGEPGAPGGYYRVAADGRRTRLADKATNVAVQAGERVVVETSGGGGIGPPDRREPDALEADRRSGRVSDEAIRTVYGQAGEPRP